MDTFYSIFILIIGLNLIYQIISFLKKRLEIKNQKYEFIELKRYKFGDFSNIIIGIIIIGFSFITYKMNAYLNQSIFWFLIGFTSILNGILTRGEYIFLNSEGIKETRMVKWDLITKIRLSEFIKTEFIFETTKKSLIIDFYTAEKINEFKNIVKRVSPMTYELYLDEVK